MNNCPMYLGPAEVPDVEMEDGIKGEIVSELDKTKVTGGALQNLQRRRTKVKRDSTQR